MRWYIFQDSWAGREKVWDKHDGKFKPVEIQAESREEALDIYLKSRDCEEDRELYHAGDADYCDRRDEALKETGCDSWEEYEAQMHPTRPVEL